MLRKSTIGIHTVSASAKTSRKNADELLDIFGNIKDIRIHKLDLKIIENPKTKCKYIRNHYDVRYVGKDRGVHWLIRFDEYEYLDADKKIIQKQFYIIEAVINPKTIVGETDYITAANESYIEPMIMAYNKIAGDISEKMPLFHHFRLKEIHFCINFQLKDLDYPYLVAQMMKLFKGGYIPHYYKELTYRCKKSHEQKSYDHSFYLISNSVLVNCYDKQAQLIAHETELIAKKIPYNKDAFRTRIKEAEGILRFEIQCKYHKIQNMIQDIKKHYEINYKYPCWISYPDIIKILLSDAMAKKVLYDYFSRVIGLGDYLPLSTAKEIVMRNCSSPKKERLISVLELINEKRGIHKAKAILDADVKALLDSDDLELLAAALMKVEEFRKSLRELNELNINPMTLPLGIAREYKTSCIPNLFRTYLVKNGISEESMKLGVVNWPEPYFYPTYRDEESF